MNGSVSTTQSTFVTTLAWILIVLGGLGVAVSLLQNVMINLVMPTLDAAHNPPGRNHREVPIALFRVVGIVMLGIVSFLTYAAYALLKRRDWARRTFVVLFALAILFSVLWLVAIGLGVGSTFFSLGSNAPAAILSAFGVMVAAYSIFVLGFSILFTWLIRRLRSPVIKAEFIGTSVVT